MDHPGQQPESQGKTSLLLSSASTGDMAGLQQLLDEGASIDSCDYDKRTALHLAASEGYVPMVELLLKRGATVNAVDRWGDTVHSLAKPRFSPHCPTFKLHLS